MGDCDRHGESLRFLINVSNNPGPNVGLRSEVEHALSELSQALAAMSKRNSFFARPILSKSASTTSWKRWQWRTACRLPSCSCFSGTGARL